MCNRGSFSLPLHPSLQPHDTKEVAEIERDDRRAMNLMRPIQTRGSQAIHCKVEMNEQQSKNGVCGGE